MSNDIPFLRKELADLRIEINGRFERLEARVDEKYVSQKDFVPIRNFTWGVIGMVMAGFMAGLIALVMR